jgi:hypothetical protein
MMMTTTMMTEAGQAAASHALLAEAVVMIQVTWKNMPPARLQPADKER